MRQRIRRRHRHHHNDLALEAVARWSKTVLRGWVRYYGRFYPSALREALRTVDRFLARWAQHKHKGLRGRCGREW